MLILTRKLEQSIVIQGDIVVTVLGVDGDRVRLGISAPENISILRKELVDAKEPVPLRPRQPRGEAASSQGNLALKPSPKER
jgi:carbon storage regulator CsrA